MLEFRSAVIGVGALLLAASISFAQSPGLLSFQGYLTDSGGSPINNASQSITFAIYKNGTKIWEETQSVAVADGVYNVLLGEVVPIDTMRFNAKMELGVKVGADPEITPRILLASTATARSLPGLYTYFYDEFSDSGYNIVGGSPENFVGPGTQGATLFGGVILKAGGLDWRNEVTADYATVSGGVSNKAGGKNSTLAGGQDNETAGQWSTIGGGSANYADGATSTIAGGLLNRTFGDYSFIGGGFSNIASGYASFAGGWKARAKHDGTFVWNDFSSSSGNDSLLSTAANQFIIRAVNGVGINQAPAGKGIHLKQQGTTKEYGIRTEYSTSTDYWETWIDLVDDYNFAFNGTLKAFIWDTDGSYHTSSDARLKKDLEPFQGALSNVLKLRPYTYRFIDASPESPRSLGFIAQDVAPLFPNLVSEKEGMFGLNYSGFGVVAIEAIQEMYARFEALYEAQNARIERLESEVQTLKAQRGDR